MSKPKLNSVVLLATLGVMPAFVPLYAGTIQEQVSITPGKTITPQEEAVISSSGVKVLRHIAQARAYIHQKDAGAAQKELSQADKLLEIIHQAVPTTTIKDRIWVAKKHLEYEDTESVLPDLIPIYSSLDELMGIMPVKAARVQLDRARENLRAGDKSKARKALDETDAALQYTEIDLPLGTTQHLVAQARVYLGKKQLDDADSALKSAEDSVVFISVGIEQPLFAAKTALYQSVVDLEAGQKDLAKIDLQNAINFFEAAKQSADVTTRAAAGELLAEARQLLTDLKNDSSTNSRFHHLLERAQAYSDRAVEYLATGWERYRAEGYPFKSDLIEARMHLADARIDLYTGHDTGGAKQELEAVNEFLNHAEQINGKQTGNEGYKQQLDQWQATLRALSNDPSSGGLVRYMVLQQQLDDMIHTL